MRIMYRVRINKIDYGNKNKITHAKKYLVPRTIPHIKTKHHKNSHFHTDYIET